MELNEKNKKKHTKKKISGQNLTYVSKIGK